MRERNGKLAPYDYRIRKKLACPSIAESFVIAQEFEKSYVRYILVYLYVTHSLFLYVKKLSSEFIIIIVLLEHNSASITHLNI